jgi:hypothetical protein
MKSKRFLLLLAVCMFQLLLVAQAWAGGGGNNG